MKTIKILNYLIIFLIYFINLIQSEGSKCDGDMNYLPLDTIQPFGLTTQTYELPWSDGFPNVDVKVVGNSNPMIVGALHPKSSFIGDDFFNYTGYQDIKTLMHYSCGSSPSTVEFNLHSGYAQRGIAMVIFGMLPSTKLQVQSATVDGPLNSTEFWQPTLSGVLVHTDPHSKVKGVAGAIDIEMSLDSQTTYTIFEPPTNTTIAHLNLTLTNECTPPDCRGTVLFYSLISIKDCLIYTVTHPPRSRARPNELREQNSIRKQQAQPVGLQDHQDQQNLQDQQEQQENIDPNINNKSQKELNQKHPKQNKKGNPKKEN